MNGGKTTVAKPYFKVWRYKKFAEAQASQMQVQCRANGEASFASKSERAENTVVVGG